MNDLVQLLEMARAAAKMAGDGILKIYHNTHEIEVFEKEDKTPVTNADQIANDCIIKNLPNFPVLSEESELPDLSQRLLWERFWLVDPLDGTKEFLKRTDEFTVNIALIERGKPILGVVYVPVADMMYYATHRQGSFRYIGEELPVKIKCSKPENPLRVVVSRRHNPDNLSQQLSALGEYETIHAGSSLKFCMVADGSADIYPRLGPTSQWDTAAGQCVLEEAGGEVIDRDGKPLSYTQEESVLNPTFYALSNKKIISSVSN